MINLLARDNQELERPIIYRVKLHWISYILPVAITIVGSIGILPVFIFKGTFQMIAFILVFLFYKGVSTIMKKKFVKIYITEGYLSISSGVFSKSVIDISLNKMEGMHLYQNWIGKLFNVGTIVVSTGGVMQKYTIGHPMELRDKIMDQI